MKLTSASSLQEVAVAVGAHLASRGIRAVLTGGACVAIHTATYVSKDADFVLQGRVAQRDLEQALGELGFVRQGPEYVHNEVPFTVEFPPGPLSIGDDLSIVPVELWVGKTATLGLSATDSCRDRLAAFYHWNDRQALALAVEIARARPVDFDRIRDWSAREGKTAEFGEFLRRTRERPQRIQRDTSAGTRPTSPRHRR